MKFLGARCGLTVAFGLMVLIDMASAADSPAVPERFRASIGGFTGTSYWVEMKEGALIYSTRSAGQTSPSVVTLHPSNAQWEEFRRALDAMMIWQWRQSYVDKHTFDGTQWSLDLRYADRSLQTSGSNRYPDDAGHPNDSPEMTKAFRRFLEAVETLIGDKPFE